MTPTVSPLPAAKALDAYFLEARSKLLDLAAILDRVGRGPEADAVCDDPRMAKVRESLEALGRLDAGRAERIQQIFSRPLRSELGAADAALTRGRPACEPPHRPRFSRPPQP